MVKPTPPTPAPLPKTHPVDAPRRQIVGGRPSALTEELVEQAREFLKQGVPLTTVASLIGVSGDTFKGWIKRGRIEERRLEGNNRARVKATEIKFLQLARVVVASRAHFEANAIKRIQEAGARGAWAADAWMLTKLLPARYREQKATSTTIKGDPLNPLQVTHSHTFLEMAKQVFAAPTPGTKKLPPPAGVADVFGVTVLEPDQITGGDDAAEEANHGQGSKEDDHQDLEDPTPLDEDDHIDDG